MTMIQVPLAVRPGADLPRTSRDLSRVRAFLVKSVAGLAAFLAVFSSVVANLALPLEGPLQFVRWALTIVLVVAVASALRHLHRWLRGDFEPVDYSQVDVDRSKVATMLALDPVLFERALNRSRARLRFHAAIVAYNLPFGIYMASIAPKNWSEYFGALHFCAQWAIPLVAFGGIGLVALAWGRLRRDEGQLDVTYRWIAQQRNENQATG